MSPSGRVSRRPHVLIVDDHRVFTDVLARQLRLAAEIHEVDSARSVTQARAKLQTQRVDVVLLDPDLGGESGFDLIPALDHLPQVPGVVVLADEGPASAIARALRMGVDAWVTKGDDLGVLLHAITAVERGHLWLPGWAWEPVVRELLVRDGSHRGRHAFVDELTVRQRQVLECLVAGLTRAEIGARLNVSPHTVRTHIRDMLNHTGAASTPRLVAEARESGMRSLLI